jgi:diketogulonate reductase-like aldo/keto reductase
MADGRIDYATSTIDSLSIAVSASVPFITLNNGLKMPQLGLGTYDQGSNETACQSALTALRAGYRKFDCAHLYFTEEGIGQGIKESGVPRDSIWITSKLTTTDYDNNNTMASIDAMLRRLQIDYLDLLYIHHPQGRVEEAWPVLEEAVRQGKVRALGVSNFDRDTALLRRIMTIAQIKPVTIQVECHPYRQLPEFRKLCAEYNLQVETWFPLGGTMSNRAILREPVITAIAAVHNKSAAQVILRWHMQMGFCTFPGARNPAYIQENIKIFDFKLSNEEMTQIESINRNRGIFNPAYYE